METVFVKAYSVSEIAEKIRRPGEDLRVVGDRIRNWTREGLLDPEGEKHPGTGRKRVYPESALLDAVLLEILTEAVGVPAVKAGPLLADAKFFMSRKLANEPLLVLSKSAGDVEWAMDSVPLSKFEKWVRTKKFDTHTIID